MVMGSVYSCSIEGLGIVAIKHHDGNVITLSYVKWVPKFRRNLFVSKLSEAGLVRVFKSNSVENTKLESGKVITIGNRIGNLNILRGDTL